MNKCPGQDSRKAHAESIICSNCDYVAEIFSDEFKVRCPKCKNLICKERLPACVDWCKAARECIGEEKWKQLKACPPLPDGRRQAGEVNNVLLSM